MADSGLCEKSSSRQVSRTLPSRWPTSSSPTASWWDLRDWVDRLSTIAMCTCFSGSHPSRHPVSRAGPFRHHARGSMFTPSESCSTRCRPAATCSRAWRSPNSCTTSCTKRAAAAVRAQPGSGPRASIRSCCAARQGPQRALRRRGRDGAGPLRAFSIRSSIEIARRPGGKGRHVEFPLRRMRYKSDFPALSETIRTINKTVESGQRAGERAVQRHTARPGAHAAS